MSQTHDRTHHQAAGANELLSVRIGTQEFALDIRAIREIRGWTTSTPLAHAPSYIKGMINLRGAVLTIVDLAKRLGLSGTEPNAASVIVVVELGDQVAGLLVDAVCEIFTVTDEMRQATPHAGDGAAREFIEGLIMMDDRIISVMSIRAIMPEAALDAPDEMR
ncbi:chemotaxis protein CheW [Acidocella sp.]|jgi:purine-binding chemotaxis protein CheW|uniref:chemotaxis protein CheW n=1 Tax=Acidocella sp. TaxID=50710 RepID=UPI002F3F8DA6